MDPNLERFPGAPVTRGDSAIDLIIYAEDRTGHDRRYAIDCTKLYRTPGFDTKVQIDAGLSDTVRWYLENESGWRSVMDGRHRELVLGADS